MAGAKVYEDVSLNYTWLVLDTVRKMRDGKAKGDTAEYYTHFEFSIQMLLAYIDAEEREKIERDFREYRKLLKAIKDGDANEQTKKRNILLLKEDFADAHRYYVMAALSKAGIIKVSDEGLIDFEKKDINEVRAIVRSGGGVSSTVKRVVGNGNKTKTGS